MAASRIRDARFPADRDIALGFIAALQQFEHAFEPNRRLDEAVAAEFLDILLRSVAEKSGIVRVAERDGEAIGWAVAFAEEDDIYVVAEQRSTFYISELYVVESARGQGVGRALMSACEDWAKSNGYRVMMIGVLPGNKRAADVYARAGFTPYAIRLRKPI